MRRVPVLVLFLALVLSACRTPGQGPDAAREELLAKTQALLDGITQGNKKVFRDTLDPEGLFTDEARNVPLKVRKSIGHEAGRFGRPWTIVVTLPGQPAEPWAFMPEEGLIVEQRKDSFTVAMADLSRPERMHRLGERLDHLLGQRA